MRPTVIANVTCVSIGGRGLLIEGPPGIGKSSLALGLIDRGASLVGDDGIEVTLDAETAIAHPPPVTAGLLEIRGVGIVTLGTVSAPLCLVIALGPHGDRLPEPTSVRRGGARVPHIALAYDHLAAIRAEWALRAHGLALPDAAFALSNHGRG